MSLVIHPFHDPVTGTWSYILVETVSKHCAIIDPVLDFDISSGAISHDSADRLLDQVISESLECRWILETHAHADHLTAADYIRSKIGGKTVISSRITEVQTHFAGVFNLDIKTDGSQFDRLVQNGDKLELGNHTIEVFETPGHTSDSIIYKIDKHIFLGDTFFHPQSGTARCDFPGGSSAQLFDSLSKILSFSDDCLLWLCHDYPGKDREAAAAFSVAEMKNNIHWLSASQSKQRYMELRDSRDAQLAVPKLLYPALQVNICAGKLPKTESNGANYLKIPLSKK